jgi:ankyrin repeat protein
MPRLIFIIALLLSLIASPTERILAHRPAKSDLNRKLVQAVDNQQWFQVTRLLKSGASANAKCPDGSPVLTDAALWGHAPTVSLLLKEGARVNARGPGGETALMVAAAKANAAAVRLLIRYGARVSLRSANGASALSLVSEKNAYPSGDKSRDREIEKTIRVLRQAGAR